MLRAMRAFHVQRAARERYDVERALFGLRGDLLTSDAAGIRRLALRMNAARPPGAPGISAGEIGALGLLHEIGHLLIDVRSATPGWGGTAEAMTALQTRLGDDGAHLLDRFGDEFPAPDARPEPPEMRLEELLLIRVANENPAAAPIRELVDDRELVRTTRYLDAVAALEHVAGDPDDGFGGRSLIELLRLPARRAPTSLAGQLRYIREAWGPLLGASLDRLLARIDLTLGVLIEEDRALHQRFGGDDGRPGDRVDVPVFPPGVALEPEAFSADSAWMPSLVLIAKSTYVWLDQLSRTHGREIRTLDAIPDEELDTLRDWGVTGLWLIGLWARSEASERIKRMRGNPVAVASAYSLDDYVIADDLGGDPAYGDLRERAWLRGIRLASDMVPNHMGIDSHWVVEHPEWFLSLPEPPYPAYAFSGPDLSSDPRVGIVLEDHYWDDSDAAVVFKRFDRKTGDERYIYHGNDGTSFPWNDTAQLDYLNPEVREQVIGTILEVARRFPVIRFDAAMVLAREHIQRLWWPEPGRGDGIPSRAEHAIPAAEFDARMPAEFWREVVDRVAAEVPGTLLLAEAFWMLEGYFVRTLGMHRVYNSAFMHMLRDENGAGYRRLIRDTLEFDPEILKRYVNFMSNPDEKTALEQFGKGDKYFGVASVMATLPGLPMLGHGQVQGFGEKYGMEFRRATLDERPDPALLERHRRELFPILHRRAWFAEAHDFLLFDARTDDGTVDEHVLAYSNGSGPTRSLVLYHDRFETTTITIRESVRYARKRSDGSKRMVRRTLAEGLGLSPDPTAFVAFRDARTGLEWIRSCRDIREHGLRLTLPAYGTHVFWEFREIRDGPAHLWAGLTDRLAGRPVPSLDAALADLQLEPLHAALRAVASSLTGLGNDGPPAAHAIRAFYDALAAATGLSDGPSADLAIESARRAAVLASTVAPERADDGSGAGADRPGDAPPPSRDMAAGLAWVILAPVGTLAPGLDHAATAQAWFDELRLGDALAAGLRAGGLDDAAAAAATDLTRTLLGSARPSELGAPVASLPARWLEAWLADDRTRVAVGVHAWDGAEWLDRDRFVGLLRLVARLDAIDATHQRARSTASAAAALERAAERAGYRLDRLVAAVASNAAPSGRRRSRARPTSSVEEDPPNE